MDETFEQVLHLYKHFCRRDGIGLLLHLENACSPTISVPSASGSAQDTRKGLGGRMHSHLHRGVTSDTGSYINETGQKV